MLWSLFKLGGMAALTVNNLGNIEKKFISVKSIILECFLQLNTFQPPNEYLSYPKAQVPQDYVSTQ